MTGAEPETARPRVTAAVAVCVGLLLAGVVLAWAAGPPPVRLDLPLPAAVLALLLVPAYVFANYVTVDFEVGGDAHSVTLSPVPLALGALLVMPYAHLAACLTAAVTVALSRRQPPLKVLYNVGAAGFEVGMVAAAVSLAPATLDDSPGRALWLLFFLGIVLGDVVGSVALSSIWRLLDMPLSRQQVLQPLALGVATSVASTALAVVTVSAAYTEPASILLVLLVGAFSMLAYRRHRRLVAQQATTQELYAFVRDLGPVDVDDDAVTHSVLTQIRRLLNAERLDLLTARSDGSWQQLTGTENGAPSRVLAQAPSGAHLRQARERSGPGTSVSTPLYGGDGLLGVLTASGRLGVARSFDLGDVLLLDTVGSQLATGLERGHLLTDLRRAATVDPHTGLPNLSETTRLLDQGLQAGGAFVVAALTVDSYHEVNDTLGYLVGDELLRETAERLRRTHPGAIIGRTGGGRFAVAIAVTDDELSPQLFGLGIRAHVEGQARVGQVGTHIRLSVGVAQSPENGTDAGTLLRRAETAMTSAQHVHGGPVTWAPAYEVQGQRRLAVVTALREAVVTGAIGLALQPKLDPRSGLVTGVEALARWTHPALGSVAPDEFVPLAETSGAIGPLTSTVLRQAATACQGWQRRSPDVGVAVNVSAETVLDPEFISEVQAVLRSTGLAARLLTLELTEGVVVGDPGLAIERLAELRALGCRIAVDDFGTGYSSLAYLKGLPVDEVKIDKGFIAGLLQNEADQSVVRAVVDIGHTLGLTVVAEGVETAGQQDLLVRLGVDEVQGYLHARPMPVQGLAGWMRARGARSPA